MSRSGSRGIRIHDTGQTWDNQDTIHVKLAWSLDTRPEDSVE
jgi:hypothetical protein